MTTPAILVTTEDHDGNEAVRLYVDQLKKTHGWHIVDQGMVFRGLTPEEATLLKTFGGTVYSPAVYYPLS